MPRLTKSRFLYGRQCDLRLWRAMHGVPERAEGDADPVEDFVAELSEFKEPPVASEDPQVMSFPFIQNEDSPTS